MCLKGKIQKHSQWSPLSPEAQNSVEGSIHLSSRIALHFIADARSQRLNIPIHQGRSELMQRISAALHKGTVLARDART